jgi:hypothetical protein
MKTTTKAERPKGDEFIAVIRVKGNYRTRSIGEYRSKNKMEKLRFQQEADNQHSLLIIFGGQGHGDI